MVPGPASKELGESLAKGLKIPIVDVEPKVFPDGESKLRITRDVSNKALILVQSTYPPVDRHLMQLLFLAHRLSEEGGQVHALIPYLAYARQDKEFLKGEVVSLAVVSRLLKSVGVKRMVTVDIHSSHGLGFFSFPAYSVSAIPLIADYFRREFRLKEPIAVSPDLGGSTRVEAFAKVLGSKHMALKKFRDKFTGEVRLEEEGLDVRGKDVLIIDDIISTGGSVQKAAQLLRKAGASKILVGCTHPILVDDALKKMREAGVDECVGTNTIPSPISKIDVTPTLVSYFKSIIKGENR